MILEESPETPTPPEPARQQASSAAGPRSRWRKLLTWLVIIYGISIVVLWLWMVWDGDRGWLATLVLFGPRWMCSIPLPFLTLAAAVYRRVLLVPLTATAVVILFPILGFQVHLPAAARADTTLRVLSCNVDEKRFRISSLAELIVADEIDIVALQEVRENTPYVWPPGWHVVERDQFILASRWPITMREFALRIKPRDIGAIRYRVQSPEREIQVFNLHFSTPRPGLEAVLSRKTLIDPSGVARLAAVLQLRAAESEQISAWVAQFPGAKIVMGDFNTPAESTIFRRCWPSLADAFSTVGWGLGFTKITGKEGWSYGARIDHVLFSPEWRCLHCWVGPEIGSDHLPLLAEFEWRGDAR